MFDNDTLVTAKICDTANIGLRRPTLAIVEPMTRPNPPPEAVLIERLRAASRPRLSIREAAARAGLSEGRWRQIAKGYQQVTKEVVAPVSAPADTLARMAIVVGASPEELSDAGRDDAAELVMEQQPEIWQQWMQADSVVDAIQDRTAQDQDRSPVREVTDEQLMEEIARRYLLRRIQTEPAFAAKMRRAAGRAEGEHHEEQQESRTQTGGQVDSGTDSGPGDEGAPIDGLTMTERVAQIEDEIRSLPGATGEALITHLRDTAAEWDRDHIDEGRGEMPNRGA